jgi:hypothetical protein
MYNLSFNHDHKFWTILIIKDIQKSRFNVENYNSIQSNVKLLLKGSRHVYIPMYNSWFNNVLHNRFGWKIVNTMLTITWFYANIYVKDVVVGSDRLIGCKILVIEWFDRFIQVDLPPFIIPSFYLQMGHGK